MKQRLTLATLGLGLSLLAAGCSDKQIHVDQIRSAMSGLNDHDKAMLEQSLTNITASNYVAAAPPLRWLAFNAKMDKGQRKVLDDTIVKVRAKINSGAK